jgi:hypothetical protein
MCLELSEMARTLIKKFKILSAPHDDIDDNIDDDINDDIDDDDGLAFLRAQTH